MNAGQDIYKSGNVKFTGKMCAHNRATCDTACALCVHHEAEATVEQMKKYKPGTGACPAPERFVLYCGCAPVEIRVENVAT